MKKLILTVTCELPEDEWERAEQMTGLRGPILEFRAALDRMSFKILMDTQIVSVGRKRGRPPGSRTRTNLPEAAK